MIKIKRLLAGFIDYVMICVLMDLIYTNLQYGMIKNNVINTIFTILFVLCVLCLVITKDLTLTQHSIGKRICKLKIVNNKDNNFMTKKISILRNLISLLTLPISFFSIFLFNISISDIIFKTKVVKNEYDQKSEELLNNKKTTKFSVFGIVFLFTILVMLSYALIIYVFFQKINYYSLRVLLITIILLIWLLINKFVINKTTKKKKLIIVILVFIIISVMYGDPLEQSFIKNKKATESFYYNYPRGTILKKYEYEDFCFIFYLNEGKNGIVHYNKKNDIWNLINSIDQNQSKKKMYTEISTTQTNAQILKYYNIYFDYIESEDKTLLVLQSNNILENVKDSIKSNFEKFNYNDEYYWSTIIKGKLNKEYFIFINNEKYFPLK